MLSIFVYIAPAVVVRYLFLGRPLGKFAAACFCVLLFLGLFALSLNFYMSISDDPHAMAWSGSPIWILIASVWSYFILRAKSREQQTPNPTRSSQQTSKRYQDSVESKPKQGAKPKKETAQKPTTITSPPKPVEQPKKKDVTSSKAQPAPQKPIEQPKKKEPVKTEKQPMSSAHDDEKFYEQVAAEIEADSIKQGLWLKAETKAGGDKDKARLLYIEWRVEQLTEEEREAQKQLAEEEREAQRKEEEREVQRQKEEQ